MVRGAGRGSGPGPRVGRLREPRGVVGCSWSFRGAHRVAPGLGAGRGRVRRTAGCGLRPRCAGSSCLAGVLARAAAGRLGVRGGGGVAVRAGVPGVAAGDGRRLVGDGSFAEGPVGGVGGGRSLVCVPGRTRWCVAARGCRDVRGAARRAGPGPGRPAVRADRRRERDLAARAVPVRVRRLRRPRRHDADGGPRRPDADLRDDRAGGQQAGAARRPAGDVRARRGDAELDELRALGGDGVAGRAGVLGGFAGRAGVCGGTAGVGAGVPGRDRR